MQLTRVVQYDEKDYTLATITNIVAKSFVFATAEGKPLPPLENTSRLITASLVAGGMTSAEAQSLVDSLPLFLGTAFSDFQTATYYVNGMQTKGKAEAEPSPAVE
jgi:hypothetical protein